MAKVKEEIHNQEEQLSIAKVEELDAKSRANVLAKENVATKKIMKHMEKESAKTRLRALILEQEATKRQIKVKKFLQEEIKMV